MTETKEILVGLKDKPFLWFLFSCAQCLCDANKILVENIYNFMFFRYGAFFVN